MREGLFDNKSKGPARNFSGVRHSRAMSSKGGYASENSSRYINTDHKRGQMSARGT